MYFLCKVSLYSYQGWELAHSLIAHLLIQNQNQIKSFIYPSPNSTAQIYIYNYDNLLCDQNMVVELCRYACLSGSSAGLGIELALFSSRSCGNYKRISYMVTRGLHFRNFEPISLKLLL